MPLFLVTFLDLLLQILTWAVIGRALLSWFDPSFRNPISRFLFDITEPILGPIRRLMPGAMMIDFSPFVAILLLQLLQRALIP